MDYPKLSIPIVDAATRKVAGGFCSTRDAVSDDEIAALEQLRRLREEGQRIKTLLESAPEAARTDYARQLSDLRQQAAHWREIKEQATLAKNRALGHVTLALDG
ncbi:MAG: hypothetical protein G8345_19270 [Magnetococcales bacterium]|nr:hypothetical protein [Magnetococcales bacterium]NGZ29017.1 hypothetical protein [Magnetococcales bacterium]